MAFNVTSDTLKEIVQALVQTKAQLRSTGSTLESLAPLADDATMELLSGMATDLFEKASTLQLLIARHSRDAFGAK